VKSRIQPMCDQPVPTIIDSDEGAMHFQEYLVKRRAEPIVRGIRFEGVETASPRLAYSKPFASEPYCDSVPVIR